MQSLIWALLLSILSFTLQAKPQYAVATHGKPKYAENFTHFDYVNPKAPHNGTLSLGVLGTFNKFNPFILKGDSAAGILPLGDSLLHACLMVGSHDEIDSRYGLIAESTEMAPDRTWVDFHLRKTAVFSDNTPIRAQDVAFTFKILVEKGIPLFKMYYKDVKGVKVLSDKHVRFLIKDPTNREIQNILGQMPVLSEKFYTKNDFTSSDLTPPVGSGPYTIKSFSPGREVVFERITNWWGNDIPCMKGRHNPSRVKFLYFMDDAVCFEAFKAGKYNFRVETSIQRWLKSYKFPAVHSGKVVKTELPIPLFSGTHMLVCNTRKPHLQDIRVRQALSLALDFESLNKRLFGGMYKRSYSYFEGSPYTGHKAPSPAAQALLKKRNPHIPEHILTKDFTYTYPHASASMHDRLVQAQSLLKEAGYIHQEDVLIHAKDKQPLALTIVLPRASQAILKFVQDYIRNLERIGIQVTLRLLEASQLILAQQKFDYDLTFSSSVQSSLPGNEQREMWSCKAAQKPGTRNLAGICDPAIDQVIEDIIDADSMETLMTTTQVLDRLLLWGFYNLPLWYNPTTLTAHHKSIRFPQNYNVHRFNIDTLWIEGDSEG